jgi:flagellar capping protein FliD
VIDEINNGAQAAGSGVRARINDTGDGLLIEDTTPGSGTLRIEDLYGGTTAKDLNIVGSAPSLTPAKIDGSFEFNIDIKASSTLNDIVSAINSKGIPVTAAVINDQSAYNPYKLTIFSMTTGKAGRLVVDTDISDLAFSTTTTPQDAVLLFGGQSGTPGTTDPILISSSSNTITNTVPGLTLDLLSVSSNPVTVTISRDTQGIIDQVSSFVNAYNTTIDKIAELTKFDPSTYKTGPLFADSTIRTVQRDLASLVSLPVSEIPSSNINSLQQIGVRVVSGGKLSFDESALRSAMDTKFDQVRDLFILQRRLKLDTSLQDINNGRGVQTVIGNDFQIRLRNGTTLDIDVSSNDTIGSLLSKINYATGNNGQLTASISSDGFSIVLTDSTTGSYTLKVTAQNGSLAAADLRIDKEAPSGKNVITGDLINLKNDPGVGFRISERLDFITMSDGLIDTKTDSIDKQIEGYNKDEKKLEDMMEKERERLTKQYAALDALISQSQATMQRLQSIFGGMSTTTSK